MGTGLTRIAKPGRGLATVVAVVGGMCVVADLPTASTLLPLQAQQSAPSPSDPAAVALHVLTAVNRGERPGHVSIRNGDFPNTFSRTAASWVRAAPAQDRERREQVTAAALLLMAYGAIDGTIGGGTRFRTIVEQQCRQMRRGSRTEFERRWMMASLALAESSSDRQFLAGTLVPCADTPGMPCDHLSHVRERFPDESLVRLIELSPQPVSIVARQPGALAGQLARARLQGPLSGPASRVISVPRLEAGLQPLLSDPIVGTDARLRLGLLRYGLNQRRESLDELARVIATSPYVEQRVTAHYVSALIHDADMRPDAAMQSFEAAIAEMPHIRSMALTLATRYHLAGRLDDASALLDRTFAASPPAFDPWRARYAVWTWYQASDRLLELFR